MKLERRWTLADGRAVYANVWRTNAAERAAQGLAMTYFSAGFCAQGPRKAFGWAACFHVTVLSRGLVIGSHKHPS